MNWTKAKPTQPGWYLAWSKAHEEPFPKRIVINQNNKLMIKVNNGVYLSPLSDSHYEYWYGPLEVPEGPE